MEHKKRFHSTIERRPVDRPASWLGMPVPESFDGLFNYFKAGNIEALKRKIGDDIYPVDVPFSKPPNNHIALAFDFAKKNKAGETLDKRSLTAPGFFEDFNNASAVDEFDWPDPSKHMDPDKCRKAVESAPQDYAIMGVMWSAHFQDACSAFGMETALRQMILNPDMFKAVIDRITEFYLEANKIFYDAAKGTLDAVLIGNDFGSQNGLMVSPRLLRKYVLPGTKKLIDQAHSYGFKVIHHSCGSVYDLIPDLIELNVDAIHPIQALARNMEAERLKKDFGGKVSFCGGVDTQKLLPCGTAEQVKKRVRELVEMFPTGLIVSPSHEAILPDVNPANVSAIFEALA